MLREAARQQLHAVAQRGQTRRRWTAHGPTAAQQVVDALLAGLEQACRLI